MLVTARHNLQQSAVTTYIYIYVRSATRSALSFPLLSSKCVRGSFRGAVDFSSVKVLLAVSLFHESLMFSLSDISPASEIRIKVARGISMVDGARFADFICLGFVRLDFIRSSIRPAI